MAEDISAARDLITKYMLSMLSEIGTLRRSAVLLRTALMLSEALFVIPCSGFGTPNSLSRNVAPLLKHRS